MRKAEIIDDIFDEIGITRSMLGTGHVIKDVIIKDGQIFNGWMVSDKEDNYEYMKMIYVGNHRFAIDLVSDEDDWNAGDIVDLAPNNKESWFYLVRTKGNAGTANRYILTFYEYKNNYDICNCLNCGGKIKYIDKFCKHCGVTNGNIIPDDDYDGAIEYVH
jgi:hypothetical protein